MQDHHFEANSDKPHYYVFDKQQDAWSHQSGSAFYRYDTVEEAMALFRFLEVERPHASFSLGVHQDFTRRADIILHVNGVNALADDFSRTAPWKSDLGVMLAARNAVKRLDVGWKIDRTLVREPVLIPNEEPSRFLPWYFEGKTLCPEDPANPLSSIREVKMGDDWISLDALKSMAKSHGCAIPAMPMVSDYLIDCRSDKSGFRETSSISPSDFELMEKRYLAQLDKRKERDAGGQSLDALKREARERAAMQSTTCQPTRGRQPEPSL